MVEIEKPKCFNKWIKLVKDKKEFLYYTYLFSILNIYSIFNDIACVCIRYGISKHSY